MSVRFRKTVSLGKGARVHFSKSGPSLSLGPRGASVSIGKRGAFANIGIPGTGFSTRTKLTGSSSNRHGSSSRSTPQKLSPERQRAQAVLKSHAKLGGSVPLKAGVSDAGEIFFLFTDTGEEITDKNVLREIKKMPEIKSALVTLQAEQQKIWKRIQADSVEASREFIEIYKLSPKIASTGSLENRLKRLKPQTCPRQAFSQPKPAESSIRQALYDQAEQNVSGIFGKRKKIEQYVAVHYDSFATKTMSEWNNALKAFERSEDERVAAENIKLTAEYEQKRKEYEAALSADGNTICELVENWLLGLTIPADVSANLDYDQGRLYLDLDLPEIEDLPTTTTKELKSGQVKVVDKTQKQLEQEYATCVLGLAFFMASNIFNLNANVSEVWISGYTQRRNKDGDLNDDYIYSIKIPREQLRETVVSNPVVDFNNFENRMKLSAAFTFSKIKPYDSEQD